jgi:hypothetical protein
MDVAALLTWVITASFGFSLFGTWLARGGLTQQPRRQWLTVNLPPPYFPAPLVFAHVALAAGGLVVWIAYLLVRARGLAWIALFMLLPVAVFGFSMFGRWLGSRRRRLRPLPPADGSPSPRPRMLAESRLPIVLVACHGVFGATTILLVLVTAARLP